MKTNTQKNQRVVFPLVGIIIVVIILVFVLFFKNTLTLWFYAQTIFNYPLPPQTTLINTSAQLVNYGGSDCTSEIRMTLKSELPYKEIENYYQNAPQTKGSVFASPLKSNDGQEFIEVVENGALRGC